MEIFSEYDRLRDVLKVGKFQQGLFFMQEHSIRFFFVSEFEKITILEISLKITNMRRWGYVTIRCNKIRSGLIKKSFNKSSNYLLILHLYSFKT